ncbi:MAG: hypothetical protein KatS3mg112_1284 [Thermogutta sp.]|nr:MAG: hypothetical protein KatS3mg112_1284 [Thermogutta sp.]
MSGPPFNVRSSIPCHRARQARPSEPFPGGTCLSGPLVHIRLCHCLRRGLKSRAESGAKAPHSTSRRDLLVRSTVQRSIVHSLSSGTTSVPLHSRVGAIHELPLQHIEPLASHSSQRTLGMSQKPAARPGKGSSLLFQWARIMALLFPCKTSDGEVRRIGAWITTLVKACPHRNQHVAESCHSGVSMLAQGVLASAP